ncbi:hypothetical protein BB561_000556 [Smittium simulii]|uniref:Endonuclease/exonuclease/phosphatase domain-containing protein n=1 Tax=Smittium simulii TaxID=133385 RepID=A0A2T9YYQ7_9FUNG|nr:hypothetical protein BB561_000556 [Smittium simulii]
MSISKVSNSSGSHYNEIKVGRMFDHILYRQFNYYPYYCTTFHTVDLSDHIPIQAERNIKSTINQQKSSKITSKDVDLADDTTLNSRNNTKCDFISHNITQSYYECNNIITWEKVKIAFKATPNNKAAGISTIPSIIWKLVQQEANPTTNFSKLTFKLINLLYNNNNYRTM